MKLRLDLTLPPYVLLDNRFGQKLREIVEALQTIGDDLESDNITAVVAQRENGPVEAFLVTLVDPDSSIRAEVLVDENCRHTSTISQRILAAWVSALRTT